MSRNQNSRFATNPTNLDISRSRFARHCDVKFTFNAGDLIPFYVDEVLPGDTFQVDTSKVVRLQTPATPFMDNIYLDYYWFFVPNRLVWEHWRELMGENTTSAWIPEVEYSVPKITSPATTGFTKGTIADYMGVPTGVPGLSINAMPFRAYALICNEWFRDQNLTDPLLIPTNDATQVGVNTRSNPGDYARGGLPFKVAKFHDYFTSCLPSPQKGPDVLLPANQLSPVVTRDAYFDEFGQRNTYPLLFSPATLTGERASASVSGIKNLMASAQQTGETGRRLMVSSSDGSTTTSLAPGVIPENLFAVAPTVGGATVNELRLAFQLQRLYEKDARGGTRYIEILKSHFGVTSPDARLQRPEYLGGSRIPINVNQVISTNGNDNTGSQIGSLGNTGAYSLTIDRHSDFTRSFVEHGFVIGLCCARYDHSYQQGLERFWSRSTRFDYYFPVLANIGEQAVKNKEIYAQGSAVNGVDDEVFGYQEAWADYRYKPSRVAGEMRSNIEDSLDIWHLADYYNSLPRLSDSWIREDLSNIDRVLTVNSSVSDQLFADIYVENYTTRAMPLYSIPGLIDHH